MLIIPLLMGAGALLGGLSGGRQRGKAQEAQLAQGQDQTRARLYDILTSNLLRQSQLGAERAQFERDSPSVRFGQALRGGLAANMQDASVNVPSRWAPSKVSVGGGLRPSAIGPQGREAGSKLSELALSQMGKDTFSIPNLPPPPGLNPAGMPRANFLDKFLGIAGPAASFTGLLGEQLGWGQRPDLQFDRPFQMTDNIPGGRRLPAGMDPWELY